MLARNILIIAKLSIKMELVPFVWTNLSFLTLYVDLLPFIAVGIAVSIISVINAKSGIA